MSRTPIPPGEIETTITLRHHRDLNTVTAVELGFAWQLAEAALPEGWCDLMVYHYDPAPGDVHVPGHYGAKTGDPDRARSGSDTMVYGHGDTPAAALRALAAKLTALR